MTDTLDTTEDQKEQMKTIRASYRDRIKEANQARRKAQRAFSEAAALDELDESKVREAARLLADRMADSEILKAKMERECKAVMTEEQLKQLAEKKAALREAGAAVLKKGLEGLTAAFKKGLEARKAAPKKDELH